MSQPLPTPEGPGGSPITAAEIARALACGRQHCPCWRTARRGVGLTHCPAHDDQHPSLSLSLRGATLWHCHAGCAQEAVLEALRRHPDLGNRLASHTQGTQEAWHRPWAESVPDPGPVSSYLRHRGLSGRVPPALRWHPALPYHQPGQPPQTFPAMVARFVDAEGHELGVHRTWLDPKGAGKAPVAVPKKFRGPTAGGAIRLAEPTDGELAVSEGIETGLAVQESTGLPTWAAGSAPNLAALTLPAGLRQLWIWADADPAGLEKGAWPLATRAHQEGVTVYVLVPPEGDWLDVLVARGAEALREAQRRARPWQPAAPEGVIDGPAVGTSVPFPMEALPESIAQYVSEAAAALQVPVGLVATFALACLAGAVGASRMLEVKEGWVERVALWTVGISPPGEGKSPSLAAASWPLHEEEQRAHERFLQAELRWQDEIRAWETQPRRSRGAPPPEPALRRLVVDDVTVEELLHLLAENPRGLIQILDEITALVRGFDQYKPRGAGSDRSRYLKMWSGAPTTSDRRKHHGKPIFVPRPHLSITGGLPPEVVADLREQQRDDGFLDRFLFGYFPNSRAHPWSENTITRIARARYERVFQHLLALEMEPGTLPRPRLVRKTPAGHQAWVDYYNEHEQERANPDLPDQLRGYYEKTKAYAARLSLLVQLVRRAEDDRLPEEVDDHSVTCAWALADWYQARAREVYGLLDRSPMDAKAEALLQWMQRKGLHRATVREICRAQVAGIRAHSEARAVFDHIVDLGRGLIALEVGGRGPQTVTLYLGEEARGS
jgi:putative DNA primase/helicase